MKPKTARGRFCSEGKKRYVGGSEEISIRIVH